jgi:hypothetical protein
MQRASGFDVSLAEQAVLTDQAPSENGGAFFVKCSLHTPQLSLDGYQLGQLGRNVCHRLFCGTQASSRGEHGTN